MSQAQNPLATKPLAQLLKSYAVPSIVAMLVNALYNIVDQIFIGQGVGYLGNAATNVSFPLVTICLALSLLIGVGAAARFSLLLGAGEKEKSAQTVGNAILMMILFGVSYFVIIQIFLRPLLILFGATSQILPYAESYTRITAFGMPLMIFITGMGNLIRADGSPRYSMRCMMLGAIVNTILDPIFIFVFKMGVAGAAFATIIGQAASCVMALLYLRQFKSVYLKKQDFTFNFSICKKIMSLGLSNSLNQVAITFVQIVMNNVLKYYGMHSIYGGDIPLAAAGVVMKVNAILLAIVIGISQGTQPIIGFNYGAKQFQRVKGTYRLAIIWTLSISAVGFILFQFFPAQIISVFGSGKENQTLYQELAVRFLRVFLFMVLINGVQLISSNFFAATGKPLKGAFLSLTRQVVFLIPLLILFPKIWGIDGVLYAGPVADVLAFITTIIFVKAEFKAMAKQQKEIQTEI